MDKKLEIAVVGGGPAGMMSAIIAAEGGAKVTLFEKMPRVGRKLGITGKGRCNLTNTAGIEEIIKNINNGKFLYSALKKFSSADTVNFFESLGVATKIERGGRIFPVSDSASEVIDALIKKMAIIGVEVKNNSPVTEILAENKKIVGVKAGGKIIKADAVILATGGASYPKTGSTGDGFSLARRLGHTITEILPALVPLEVEDDIKSLQGLSLRNIRAKLLSEGKKVAEEFGEMLFTHFGVSGPIILTLSRQAARLLHEKKFVELEINLKPALTLEQLDARILRDFDKFKGKIIKNSLHELLPSKLIPLVLDRAFIDENKRVDEINQAERRRLIENLRGLTLTITKTRPIAEAIVTSGGISSIKEINPKTMESKIIGGLYIVGEVLDVDGLTGGFNLQAAWSMGYTAGKQCVIRNA